MTRVPFPWLALPALREFVIDRVRRMREAPDMWALTAEAFGMQLALLLELATGLPANNCTPIVFGSDGCRVLVAHDQKLSDEWAQQRCDLVLARLGEG